MNVPEQEGENCANIIYDIIENELNMDIENLQFHAIHRVVNNNVYNVDNIPDNLKESSTLNSNSS